MRNYLIFIGSLKKGGVERFCALLINHLVQNKNNVTLVTLSKEVAFDLTSDIKQIYINRLKFKWRILNILYVYLRLCKIVWSTRPYRLITLSRIGGLFASSLFYPRTIVMFDIYPLKVYKKYKQLQFWFFYNLPWVRYVVSCSQELKEDVAKFFINKSKLIVIPYPVPEVSAEKLNIESKVNRPYFVIVSRLRTQKNVDQVIRTFVNYEIYNLADLFILGDGPEMENIRNLVQELDMNEYVHLKGFVRNPYPIISSAHCLISASLHEGFPNVLIESLGLETPVISSLAKTGPREIIHDGQNGLLFEVGNYEKLGEFMLETLRNTELYAHLKSNVKMGIERYSHENIMKKWSDILGQN